MSRRKHGTARVLLDVILIFLTGGLWLIWMVARFLRRNS